MLALFIAFTFSVRENEKMICVCNDACPKVCDAFEKILIYYTPDLDAEFTKLKTKYMNVRFCHAPNPFTFNIYTFDGCEVQFDSFHLAPKAHVKVLVTRASTAELSFNNLDVTFSGFSPSQELDIKSIKFNEVDSRNENIAPRLITQSFEASNSVYDFTDITIKKECSDPALSIDILRGYTLELIIGENLVTLGSSTFHFEGKSTATISTQLKDVKLTVNGIATQNMPYIILIGFPHTTFLGKYPKDYIIQMQNLEENTVIANEERLPISLDGARVNVYVSQPHTTIEGDSSCDVSLYTKSQPSFRYEVNIVKLNGNIDIYSSWVDVTLGVFNPGLQVWDAPWSFCVGRGGVSTLTINDTLYTGTSPVSAFKYHCDFKVFLNDDDLRNLLNKKHTILTVNTNKTVFTADSVFIIPSDILDIPGFVPSSNCISIEISQRYPFKISLKAVSPTTFPLKLCYADEISQCLVNSDGFFVNSYSISNLSYCIHPGFTNVSLTLKKDLETLNFGSLTENHKNLIVEIKGKSSHNPILNNILNVKNDVVRSIKFTNIDIGSGQIESNDISFIGCNRANNQDRTLNFSQNSTVCTDDKSLSIFDMQKVTNLTFLVVKLQQYNTISATGNNINFSDNKSGCKPELLDASSLTSLKINAVDTLYLLSHELTKNFQIDHEFKGKTSKNQLILSEELSGSNKITYNHSIYDVEIVRGPNEKLDNIEIVGDGEISYTNDYSSSTRICVTDNITKCSQSSYHYDDDHIITDPDGGAKIQEVPELKVYVDSYISYSVQLSNLSRKVVIFENFDQNVNKPTLTINCENNLESPQISSIIITGFNISLEGVTENTKFGHFEVHDCEFPREGLFDQKLQAVDFIGPFDALESVTDLSIDGYIELYGNVTFKKSFNIQNNTNPRRFRACIPNLTIITVSSDKISINEFEMIVGHNEKGIFDVDLFTNEESTFNLTTSSGDKMSQFPKIKFSKLISTTVNFNGNWPKVENKNEIKLVFSQTQYNFNFNINSEHVPATFEKVQMSFHIAAKNANTNIYGLFNVLSEEFHEMTISGPEKGSVNFIGGIGVNEKSWIKIINPITVTVSEVVLTNVNVIAGTISFINYINVEENSKVIITNPLKNINFNSVFQIYGDFKQSLDSPEIQKFLESKVELCQINSDDIDKFKQEVKSVEFVAPLPKTHGFIGSNFEVYDSQNSIYLRKKNDPIHTPARACFNTKTTKDCDYIITDENISSFASFLPKSIETIDFTFGNESKAVLDLNNANIQNSKLIITSSTGKPINVKLAPGSGHIDQLIAQNINFEFVTNDPVSIQSAKFENSISNSLSGIGQIEYDYDSWKRKKVDSFGGRFLFIYPENDITFKSNGWSLIDADILSSNFPNFAVNFTTQSYVNLKAERDITSVINCDIYIRTTNIEVGEYWNTITSPSLINIVSEKPLNEIIVTCKSYPFSILPIYYGTTIKVSKDTLPIHTTDLISLNNQKFTIDFSLAGKPEDPHLYADNGIILEGDSTICFPNSQSTAFPVIAKEITIKDGSQSSAADIFATDKVILQGNSTLSSSIDFSNATIEFHYWKDHIPYLNNLIELAPGGVTLFYNDSLKQSEFIQNKSFSLADVGPKCEQWLKNVKFESSVKQFRGKKAKTSLSCIEGVLTITGSKKINTLSPGAIAGIVVGCAAFVAIIVVAVVLIVRLKNRNSIKSGTLLTSTLQS